MMNKIKYIVVVFLTLGMYSCEEFMTPVDENTLGLDYMQESAEAFAGVMYGAYQAIPNRISFDYEATTDNAVVNIETHLSSRAAKGGISTIDNPLGDSWSENYLQIGKLNWFINQMVLDESQPIPTPVRFNVDPELNLQMFYFTKGEAYFLRAWYQFQLLQKYGGVADDGKAYGFPIVTTVLEADDELDLPRNSYDECVQQIVADCNQAASLLPLQFTEGIGNILDGLAVDAGHASGIAALALKARTLLYAASPAFNSSNSADKWDAAAAAAAEAISAIGDDNLLSFDNYFSSNNLNDGKFDNADIFFRGAVNKNVTTYESENFPPRAFSGKGRFNPSQNLVDAFPMKDGYPRGSSPAFSYDETQMFNNRDPRLDRFVVHKGETWANVAINTESGGADAFGSDPNATRSGYYLQKLLDGAVSLEPGKIKSTSFVAILLGRPELYLNFAEAAIQATGNPNDNSYGFSAAQILAKVRNRALGAGNDNYLQSVSTKEDFLELVKNERRIELCFEDHRFWDLRRWAENVDDLSELNVPAYGIYSGSPLENRLFASPYMPLPYEEMIKTQNLVNNAGW